MKKVGIVVGVLLLVVVGAGALAYWLFVRGTGGFDDWAVRKVVTVAERYLVPDVEFTSFEYDPGLVTLEGVTLVAPGGVAVVEAATMKVALAGIPTPGTGVVIERVEIHDARLHLIRDETGGFKGLVPFLERENLREQERVPEDERLSSAFKIRRIALRNCALVYEDPRDDRPAMRLDQIDLEMDVQPETGSDGARVYALQTSLDRRPILSLDLNGMLDLDALTLDVESLVMATDLEQQQAVAALPPQLQSLLERHDAAGSLELEASGRVPLLSPLDATLDADVALDSFHVAAGEYRVPIESATVDLSYDDRLATLGTARLNICRGTVDADGSRIDLRREAPRLAEVEWRISGFHLEDLLRTRTEGTPPKYAGIIDSTGAADVRTLEPLALSGSGDLSVRDGHLTNIPVIRDLASVMKVLDQLAGRPTYGDTADASFRLGEDAVEIEELSVETQVLVARGDGEIGYDGRLDLLLNAGPLEKFQRATGVVGDIIGAVTDRLVKYSVKGEISQPQIGVRPLGLGG